MFFWNPIYFPWSDGYLGSHIQSLGEGNGTALQYSCLENPMDGGARWATVHGVAKSWTRLRDFTFFSLSFCFSFSILIPFYYQIYYMHTQTIFTFHHLSRNTPFILVSLTPWDQSLIHHIKLTCLVWNCPLACFCFSWPWHQWGIRVNYFVECWVCLKLLYD